MPETSHQRQRGKISRKVLLIGGGLVAVLVIVLGVWLGVDAAGKEAERYEKAFATWSKGTKPELIKASSSLPQGTYVFDDQTSKKNLAIQKKGCDKVEQTLGKITDATKNAPELKESPFGGLSAVHGDTKKQADKQSETIQTYLGTAKKAYQQVLTDCRWNIATNTAAVKSQELYAALDKKYDQNYGERQDGSHCNNQSGCIPENDAKRKKYLDVFRRAQQAAVDKILPRLLPERCGQTSFGKDCQKLHDGYEAVFEANLYYVKVASKLTTVINSQPITKAIKVYDKADAALDKTMLSAFKKQYPEFAQTKRLKDSPGQSDSWLDAVARGRISALVKAQTDIKKL